MQCTKAAGSLRPRGRHRVSGTTEVSDLVHRLSGCVPVVSVAPARGWWGASGPPDRRWLRNDAARHSQRITQKLSPTTRCRGQTLRWWSRPTGITRRSLPSWSVLSSSSHTSRAAPSSSHGRSAVDADAVRRRRRGRRAVPETALRRPAGLARDHRSSTERSRRAHRPTHTVALDDGGTIR